VCSSDLIYVAGEGQNGITRRFWAWAIRNRVEIAKAPLFVALQPVRLIEQESVSEMIAAVERIVADVGAPALIVLDTLARNFGGGDENSPADMNAAISAADQFRCHWHSAVLFTHHFGHSDKSHGRGHSSLRGALDSEFRMEKDANSVVRLMATKTKDCEPPTPMSFQIRTVELGLQDAEGKAVTSAVLDEVPWEEKAETKSNAGHGKWQTIALDELRCQIEAHRKNVEADGRDPAEARVSLETWGGACIKGGMPTKRFWDVKKGLLEKGLIVVEHEYVSLR
jgi:hypothetical protein